MKRYILIAQTVLIAVIMYLYINERKKEPIYLDSPPETIVRIDTLIKNRVIKPMKPYRDVKLPKTVTEYQIIRTKDNRQLNRLKLKIENDSILISSLRDQISIHENYLKLFPSNPKLIDFSLDYKDLTFSLLNTDGVTHRYEYPINVLKEKYTWTLNGLTSKPIRSPLNRFEFYGGGGIDIWSYSPVASFRIEKQSSRKRFYLHTQMVLLDKDKSNVQIGLEYRLRK